MSDNSLIEWCTATWNFLIGCTKKSAGCMHCYAIRQAWRMMHNPNPKIAKKFAGTVAKDSKGDLNWTGRVNFDDDLIHKPLSWRLPRRVFVNSLSDLFHGNVKDEWIDRAFAVMAACPHLTFQILTKEPERMLRYLTGDDACENITTELALLSDAQGFDVVERAHNPLDVWPLPNVWLGTSVEDQKTADQRIPRLMETPAAVRWISAEPLLGPVDLFTLDGEFTDVPAANKRVFSRLIDGLGWVVVGGESGPKARPMHPDWARSLRDQCVAAGVPFFFKQWGEWAPASALDGRDVKLPRKVDHQHMNNAGQCKPVESNYIVNRIGKKTAGRLLDGREWDEFPEAKAVTSAA